MRIKRGKRLLRYQAMRHSQMAALWSVGIRGFFKVALAVIDGQLFIVTDGL